MLYKLVIMELLIANVNHVVFKIDRDLNEQYGALPLPFPGMDSKRVFVYLVRIVSFIHT